MSSQDDLFQPEITGPRPKGGYDSPAPPGSQKLPERIMHTPGPWEAKSEPMDSGLGRVLYYDIVDSKGRTIADTANSEVAVIHTEHDEGGKHQWDEQGRIDARLIAAAPELLEACKALQMEAAARGCGLRIADEAIAKAEGK